ncbi:class B sortase [Ruminococcus flavefaciens]|uniref:Sortase B n=1 Tax=Ruminococcus flavefaciens TaxID=1265 RepID=A0A315YG17_RUMFL|nr:class B sortase [Ruminococcus flavefaciens]PWJ09890.1 sortase B [Ruminococcus flavefaciens]SSA52181.1 sortase B [Ruminococcus flavefaciens]
MKKKTILRILAAVSAAALLLGGAYLLTKDDFRQKLKETEIKPYMPTPTVLLALDEASETETTTTTTTSITVETAEHTTEAAITTASPELSAEVRHSLIDSAQSLNSAYPNALGWLYIPDTVISYPIMQSDDNDYYLSHAYDGTYLKAGSVFLDYRCEGRFRNPINIVYAHNMKNGSMFAQVTNFKNDSYFESHKYGWLATPETVYRIDFFSCAVADWHDSLYEGDTPVAEWVPHICDKSVVGREITYSDDDRFISLSTCSYEFQNARTILTGKLVETKEA